MAEMSTAREVARTMMTLSDNIDVLDTADDDICSTAQFLEVIQRELMCFPDVARGSDATKNLFLYLRNKMLQLWTDNCREELTCENVFKAIPEPYSDEASLIERVFAFLTRYSFVNFGFFRPASGAKLTDTAAGRRISVVVIGAGVSGLSAARQLDFWGCDVTVLEARGRVGGRMSTFRKHAKYVADLGAMIVTGIEGNPILQLARQIPIDLQRVKPGCPLYDCNGKPVDKDKDSVIEKEFNRLLDAAAYVAHGANLTQVDGQKLNLGQTIELIIKQQEKRVKERKLEYFQTIVELQEQQKKLQDRMGALAKEAATLRHQYDCLTNGVFGELDGVSSYVRDFAVRSKRRDLDQVISEYDTLQADLKELENAVGELRESPPSDVYMNALDRRILEWHIANLEFANATCLDNLSLKFWDQDDEHEFSGSHLSVSDGFGTILRYISENLNIRQRSVVQEIRHGADGVQVDYRQGDEPVETLSADVCLCTLPLGVLKRSITNDVTAPRFNPPLPTWKTDSIRRLGFGVLNKVVLCFNHAFWDTKQHTFGYVNQSAAERGNLFLFWTLHQAPTLMALIAGSCAERVEAEDDALVVSRCLRILARIFGEERVPTQPVEYAVTRWSSDPFARGAYSHVGIDANGDDYDILAAPVGVDGAAPSQSATSATSDGGGERTAPRLFFAGEHTSRHYPATVHGALMSGYREAGRIGDEFLGRPYEPSCTG